MKGMLAILGCLFAAYAAPLFANQVPLILEETIQLPVATDVWDVYLLSEQEAVWACVAELPSDSIQVLWGEVGSSIVYANTANGRAIIALVLYQPAAGVFRAGLGALNNQRIGEIELSRDTSASHIDWGLWEDGNCEFNPGMHFECWFYFSAAVPVPPIPSSNQWLQWYIYERVYWSNGQIDGYFHYAYFLNQPGDWNGATRSYFKSVKDVVFHDEQRYLAWGDGGSQGMGQQIEDTIYVLMGELGSTTGVAGSYDDSLDFPVLVATSWGETNARNAVQDTFLWQHRVHYGWIFCVDVEGAQQEEVLCFRESERDFSVLNLYTGETWGHTSALEPGATEMKIIGRYHDDYRRLVVRYGTELRIYRFGEPIITDADDARPELPQEVMLSVYPNPFNPTTTLAFDLPKAMRARLVVYDLSGRQVQTLLEKQLSAGQHDVVFDGAELPSGIYFARLSADKMVKTQKLVLLK